MVFIKDNFVKRSIRFTKLISNFLIVIISSIMLIAISPKIVDLKDEKIPSLKLQKNIRESLYFYSLFDFISDDFSDTDKNSFENWNLHELEPLMMHVDTKSIYYANYILNQEINGVSSSMTILPEKILKDLEIEYSKDFIGGKSFIILDNIQGDYESKDDLLISDFRPGDSIKFKNENFILENVINYDFEDKINTFIPSRIIISEKGGLRLSYKLDTYNLVEINAQKLKSWFDYDAMVSRLSKDGYLINHRLGIDAAYMQNYYETLFIVFEILVYISLGVIISLLLFSQLFLSQRRSLAIMYFLGKSRKLIILKEALKVMVISSLSLSVNLLYGMIKSYSLGNLMVVMTVSLIPISIIFFVSFILGRVYLKENSLDTLEER